MKIAKKKKEAYLIFKIAIKKNMTINQFKL